jgi:hypothetical protein
MESYTVCQDLESNALQLEVCNNIQAILISGLEIEGVLKLPASNDEGSLPLF